MEIEQIYTGCLAQGAYYIESNGEAAIIDPLREVQPYIDMANQRHAKIKYVFETHFHADFVSGHVDLAAKTGATIVYGPTQMKTGFEAYIAKDGELFRVGNATIRLIHTPGHTLESSCFLLMDEEGNEKALFTGDTLFIGDVGRPDLAQHVIAELTEEKLAGYLYDSLHNKIMPLSDDLMVYPAHGSGSACGKNMSKETSDTLGHQKETNYALRKDLTRDQFIQELLNGLTKPPSYFPKNVLMNIQGYDSMDKVYERALLPMQADAFEAAAEEHHALILDTRHPDDFVSGFIPGSINIGINGSFAVWAGTLIPNIKQPILLVCDEGKEKETITRLARVGYDHTLGFLKGGFDTWKNAGKEIDTIRSIDVSLLQAHAVSEGCLVDVRKKSEYESEHVAGSVNLPLDYINEAMPVIAKDKETYIHCLSGYRSVIFISILKAKGFNHLVNVKGGFQAMKQSGLFKITDYVCPTTLL